MARKKSKMPFDSRGGVLVMSRSMIQSHNFITMPPTAKALLFLLQCQWRNDRPISYGVREAAAKIPCASGTASKSFKVLEERGFIACVNQSLFSSRTGSRTREWRLTWMPFNDKPPTHEWEKWR